MPTTEVTINNKPLSTMGVAMLSGAYAALLTPPSLKEFVENDDPTQNGIDIIVPDSYNVFITIEQPKLIRNIRV